MQLDPLKSRRPLISKETCKINSQASQGMKFNLVSTNLFWDFLREHPCICLIPGAFTSFLWIKLLWATLFFPLSLLNHERVQDFTYDIFKRSIHSKSPEISTLYSILQSIWENKEICLGIVIRTIWSLQESNGEFSKVARTQHFLWKSSSLAIQNVGSCSWGLGFTTVWL